MSPKGKDIQIDNGEFTRVHNSILEVLSRLQVSSLELRIILFILRKTYGFGKKSDVISLSQFESCGGSRNNTYSAIKKLIQLNIITRNKKGLQTYEYSFNKYIEQWSQECFESRRSGNAKNFNSKTVPATETSPNNITSPATGTSTSPAIGNGTVPAIGTHKRKKETIKEKGQQKVFTDQQLYFGKLAEICKVDMKLKKGQIAKTVKRLRDAGYTMDDLENFIPWWSSNDFRGRKGDPPTMAQLEEKIFQSKESNNSKPKKQVEYKEVMQDGELVFIPINEVVNGS